MDDVVDIKSYSIRDIEALLKDGTFWKLDPLPLNKQRIVSMIRSPRAGQKSPTRGRTVSIISASMMQKSA